jgi:hypothetical protein
VTLPERPGRINPLGSPAPCASAGEGLYSCTPIADPASVLSYGGHDHQWVTDRIAVGSAVATPEHVRAVVMDGITHVLDCRLRQGGEFLYQGTAVRHLHNATADDGKPKPEDWFRRGIGFVLTALAVPRSRILIHCAMGIARGPSMTYAVLRALGHTPDGAVTLIKKARPLATVKYQHDAERAHASYERKRALATRGVPRRGGLD